MSLLPRISTYYAVTDGGSLNPFELIPDVTAFGFTASEYHNYLLAFHSDMSVFNDFTRLHAQLVRCFMANGETWSAYMKTAPTVNPYTTYDETEAIVHSGTDETSTDASATDKANTYDSATMRTTHETSSDSGGSFTHGHEIETTKTRYAGGNPIESIKQFREIANYNLFEYIMKDIINAISCIVYTRETLEY